MCRICLHNIALFAGTGEPNACDAGTFNPSTMSTSADNCTLCEPGQYCNDSGLATPNGDCDIGFYCSGGSTTPRPVVSCYVRSIILEMCHFMDL